MKKSISPFCGKYCTFGYELLELRKIMKKYYGIKENNEKTCLPVFGE